MPYTQMCIWFVLAFWLKNSLWKKRFFILGMVYLFFFSNRFITNEIFLMLEIPPTPLEEIPTNYEFGIVLGGVTNLKKLPKDRVYFHKGADRITHAIQLYKIGKIKKILVTGGSSNIINTEFKEADNVYDFLILMGVDEKDILIENQARNTYENAIYSSQILNSKFPSGKHLVITSGFHLRRALLCFNKTNLNVDGFSSDFYSHERSFALDILFVPDPKSFSDWQMLTKELFGIILYWLFGYI